MNERDQPTHYSNGTHNYLLQVSVRSVFSRSAFAWNPTAFTRQSPTRPSLSPSSNTRRRTWTAPSINWKTASRPWTPKMTSYKWRFSQFGLQSGNHGFSLFLLSQFHFSPSMAIQFFFSRCLSLITRGNPCQILSQSTHKIRRKIIFCSASELCPHLSHLCPTFDIGN